MRKIADADKEIAHMCGAISNTNHQIIKLEGALKGVSFSNTDLKEAKKAIFGG